MRILPREIAPPLREPVTLAQLKAHVRSDAAEDDADLRGFIAAARAHAEQLLGRAIVPRPVRAIFDGWPCGDGQLELLVPVVSVDAVTYTGPAGGAAPAWTGFVARTSNGGVTRVRPASGQDWPALGSDPLITLDATSGYARVPDDLRQAILMIAAHWHANREAVTVDGGADVPMSARDILRSHRWRWLG